jgi:acyl-CoA reductase-like NAD-dependent aldehyde dehydrogenase
VLSDAEGEIARGIENVEFACGIPHLLKRGFSEQASRGVDVHSIRQPLGVVARNHTLQLPGYGAALDVRQRHCLRKCLHP